ncbi:MAG: ammonia-forming cytochrome c nitrite reductase subunit c552 [Anaerolineae bacterium]|nr:ammonia-forming cytochrome c nitrite reductase subunit c552 [Anaerolineae bacterium]
MRRAIILVLIILGTSCIGLGLWLTTATPVAAQEGELDDAEYVSSDTCSDCHRNLVRSFSEQPHGLALQDSERDKDLILADFDQGADLRMVQFPGEDAPRPFDEDDIVYVIGAGKYVQRYLYEVDRRVYAVLPAEWDVAAGVWRPYLLAETWPDPAYDFTTNCAGCHVTGLDVERGRWEDDGVMCEACHGPGSVHAEAADDAGGRPNDEELVEIHNAIVVSPDAQVCGQCHALGNQPFPVDYRPGGVLVHEDGYALVSEEDTSAFYGTGHARLSNMQYNEWIASGHATAFETMSASPNAQAECLTCHSGDYLFTERIRGIYDDGDLSGPVPDSLTLETASMGITCTVCHSPHTAEDEEFNLTSAPYEMCTSCHRNTELVNPLHHPVVEMFEGQAIIDGVLGVPSAHFSEEDGPRCVTCHMTSVEAGGFALANHTWKPIIPGEDDAPPDSCSGCHTDLNSADLQSLVDDTQADVRSRLSIAFARVASIAAPAAGSDAEALYQRAVAALTFVQGDGSMGVHNYAYADALLDQVSVMLTELSVPGATLEPTEAPAPTATPSIDRAAAVAVERSVTSGFRPMTVILIGLVAFILLAGTFVFVRQARRQSQETLR